MPPLVGLTPGEAERSVSGSGLQMFIERQYYSPQIAEGKIMSQLPLPGTKVRRGWQVRVAQSLGPTRVTIPDVTGESEHAAELNIRRRGLDVASMAAVPSTGNSRRSGAGAKSDGECDAAGGAEDQSAGDGGGCSAGVCDAELCRTTAGKREPDIAGCGIPARKCERGIDRGGSRSGERGGPGRNADASVAARATVAGEHHCGAVSGGGTESCRRDGGKF